MKSDFFNGMKTLASSSVKMEEAMRSSANLIVKGMERRQAEFEIKKQKIRNDIKRGSNLSKGRIPF